VGTGRLLANDKSALIKVHLSPLKLPPDSNYVCSDVRRNPIPCRSQCYNAFTTERMKENAGSPELVSDAEY